MPLNLPGMIHDTVWLVNGVKIFIKALPYHHNICTIDESIKGVANQKGYDITFDANINVVFNF